MTLLPPAISRVHIPSHADFLKSYFDRRESIDGWFMPEAAVLFLICNQLIAEQGIVGDVLEIGVHHGLSAIITASLRGPRNRFYAVDLFEDFQSLNSSGSGRGAKATFLDNMSAFFVDLDFMEIIVSPSSQLSPRDLKSTFSFCHVDGGHSAAETYQDIALSHRLLLPGGLIALDDYFNQQWPGVAEGAIRYTLDHPSHFIPVAVGFNKVVLQKPPASIELARYLADCWPEAGGQIVDFWGLPTILLTSDLPALLDMDRSSVHRLERRQFDLTSVRIQPGTRKLTCRPGETAVLRARVTNEADEPVRFDLGLIGLAYHLLDERGSPLRWDNPREYFKRALRPGEVFAAEFQVSAPLDQGTYKLEFDIVWEGVAWLKERGLATPVVDLIVSSG